MGTVAAQFKGEPQNINNLCMVDATLTMTQLFGYIARNARVVKW